MNFLDSIILGIVEGITEFLPISSTGHLILTSKILSIVDSEFLKSFEIFIQLGAILAVVYYYRKTVFTDFVAWKKVIAAFIPTALLGLALYKFAKEYLLGNASIVAYSLVIGGFIIIIFELWQRKKNDQKKSSVTEDHQYNTIAEVPYKTAIFIGVAQVVAIIPGVSRSGTTIIAGQSMGLTRKAVVEFSFLLAIPTMVAATGLDLLKSGSDFSTKEFLLLVVGFLVSFVVAIGVIKWLLAYIKNHSFILFGIYRIVVGLIFLLLFL